jgi:exopolysaccharide biosynthesis predicted pyruvyltransferase EpsI
MLGETDFFLGLQMICLQKSMFFDNQEVLEQTNNFEIFITIMNENQMVANKEKTLSVMMLLFPKSTILITPRSILLKQNEVNIIIDEGNFDIL